MAFTSSSAAGSPMADINVTPLVDVMLVLLIIFMVTAPIMSYPIDVNLPQRTTTPPPPTAPREPIKLRIDASGQVFWNEAPQPLSAMRGLMDAEVARDPTNQPMLQIDVNDDSNYEVLAKVLAHAKNADMQKIGFEQK
ncbi:MAG: biopolymer transporter ExbD [Pseudomonas sp.]|nr:biopolymer transporter ExbD [Pseudomonas sp.]